MTPWMASFGFDQTVSGTPRAPLRGPQGLKPGRALQSANPCRLTGSR